MKTNWVYKIAKYLKKVHFKNDKRVVAYFVCVAIATVFWFLNALSKTYTVDIFAPVKYVNLPANKTLASDLPEQVELTVKAHGFTILRRKISFLISPLEFNVNELTNNRMIDNRRSNFIFPTRQFLTELSYELSNDLEILSMSPDTMYFNFDKMSQKKVKVKPIVRIDLKKQYQISGDIVSIPDSVIVSGPKSILDSLYFVSTENKQFLSVKEPIKAEVNIKPVKELFFEPQAVKMVIPVEEYTEAQQSVPVVFENLPENLKIKLFPSKVKASFQVGLSRFSGIHPEDFKLVVDYSDILKGKQQLKITVKSNPAFIYDLKITPEEIEYLIEN